MSFSALSFASEVKNELARVHSKNACCQNCELAALIRMSATMVIGGNLNLGVNFSSENAAVARKMLSFIKQRFNLKTQIMISRGKRLKKNNTYHVKIVPDKRVGKLLAGLNLLNDTGLDGGLLVNPLKKICCRRAYLRGAFLGGGSVNKPEGTYHLELVTENYDFAKTILKIMKSFSLSAKMTDRKNNYIVYLKEGDAITHFLRIIGAHNALMAFENVRIVKDMRGKVNRLVNFETANLEKTANAAIRQIEDIKLIEKHLGFAKLPAELREVALARLCAPEASLSELAQSLGGRISKSGVNHRLRKLARIALELN